MHIGSFPLGEGRVFIVAEAGVNHNGDLSLARELVDAAREAGADAVKFQAFKAESLCDARLTETKNVRGVTGGTDSSLAMYRALELSRGDFESLFEYARKRGIPCFASVFDLETVDWMEKCRVPAIKIASGDLTFVPLLERVSRTGIPLVVSTGMADWNEVGDAAGRLSKGASPYAILHCVAEYPAPYSNLHLRAIPFMKEALSCAVGFSDHSRGVHAALAARALGADIIEKHLTLDCAMDGPDHALSLDPGRFARMVKQLRDVEEALGSPEKKPSESERAGRVAGRRGIKASRNLKAGTRIALPDLVCLKPALGIEPVFLNALTGRVLVRDVSAGSPIEWEMMEKQ